MSDLFEHDPARDDALILVDGLDREVGTANKERTHREGLLHRAFSVVLLREGASGPELLLARRAQGKYHSGGLWANSCCSHPRLGEDTVPAATRRVREELGLETRGLHEIDAFVYRAAFETGLVEYEYDHVLVARCEGTPQPDPTEVSEVRWVDQETLANELATRPQGFAPWALTVLPLVMARV